MYTGTERLYYLAGESVVQDFHQTAPGFLGNRNSAKEPFGDSLSASHFSRSVHIKDPDYEAIISPKKSNFNKPETIAKEPPRDLGENFVKVLLDEYKRVRHINTKDPQVLLEFWKLNKNARKKDSETLNKSMRGDKSYLSQASQTSERIRELQTIAKEREEDVAHTLEVHANVLKQEENMKKFILDAYRQRKIEEEAKKNQKPKVMSKETLDRLYKTPPPKAERPASAKTNQANANVDYDREFMTNLINLYTESRPSERRNMNPERLFNFWQGLYDKQEHKVNKKETIAREEIQKYFDSKYDIIQDHYEAKYGYKTYDHKVLVNFHKNEISEAEKKRKDIDYDPLILDKPLEQYCRKRKRENEELERQREEEARKKLEDEKERLSKKVVKKEIKATPLENLAKPKDKLAIGKTMLFLKKMFPKDRILQRMILNEFKKNKLLKYPEEYDIYDSDEEIDTLKRDELREPFKTAAREGRLLQIKDFTKSILEREQEITNPFEKYLEQKYFDSNMKLESEKQRKARESKEDKQLDRFIAVRARKYISLREKRLAEKVPTLKQFLISTYHDMRIAHRSATVRRFPNITYGYSKRLKRNSYPLEFKRHFFLLVKAISMSHGKILLPFWAPPSAGSKAHVFLDTNKSYNKRVNDLSKETKIRKIEQDYERTSCWQKEEFLENRMHIMMTYSDAKECTFTPNVGSRMPKKYKELMQQEYAAWAHQYLNLSKSSFDEWVSAMGNNFSRKFPAIYKYGKFKRAVRFWKENQFIKAYKELAEVFNIENIKRYYNPNYDPIRHKSVMFSKENLKIDDENQKPQEDFGDKANERFLQDVYILIMVLESHEKDLQKSINEYKKMAKQDRYKGFSRKTAPLPGAKTMMCPLGDKCPDDIRPRWPSSSIKTISKFGQKCEYAHHVFELKFKQEMNARKQMLEKTLDEFNKKIQSDYTKPAFNPGGAVFTSCIGCGEELRTKGVSKGVCSTCQLRKGVNRKLQMYRQKAGLKYLKLTQKSSFKRNYEEKHENETKINTKLGFYRKACVLYDNERYRDAFTQIVKAVEIVKEEKKDEEEKEQQRSDELKAKLGIDPSVTITLDMLYNLDSKEPQETGRSGDSHFGLSKAKLIAYAEKMGYIGEQKVDINEFLNYQIQVMYLKIEKALESKLKDITRLQKKIEKLEGFDEEVEERQAFEQAEGMNETLSSKKRKEKALKPKHKFDIDLVNDEKKIQNMQKTIQYIRNEIEESQPPEHWKPTRWNNVILDIEKYDKEISSKKPPTRPGEKPKELGPSMSEKDKGNSIYKREWDDLVKLPHERSSPTKF